ncbi:hypothetical protein TNCV_4313121 [Trichonephila clavipes]|nr:hypothetical protein TNCV_4313121 [Trichonephila clavipes]
MKSYSCSIGERFDDPANHGNKLTLYEHVGLQQLNGCTRYILMENTPLNNIYKWQRNSLNHQIDVQDVRNNHKNAPTIIGNCFLGHNSWYSPSVSNHTKIADRVIRYQTDKLAECVGVTETTRNPMGMQGHKCCSCEIWCKEKEQKQKHIDETENILLKGYTTTRAHFLGSHKEFSVRSFS